MCIFTSHIHKNNMKNLSLTFIALFFILCTSKAQVTSDFNFSFSSSGCSPDNVTFTNTSTNATSYFWDFGDFSTSTSSNPTHTFFGAGTYLVSLLATDGVDTVIHNKAVVISDVPSAFIFVTPVPAGTKVCLGEAITFENTSNPTTDNNFWDFGDGTTSTDFNPTHIYSSVGNYAYYFATTNTCGSDTFFSSATFDSIEVSSTLKPTASFTNIPVTTTCPSAVITFANGSDNGYNTFMWDFGDLTSSSQVSPSHSYATAGNYQVKLIATNACASDTTKKSITIDSTLTPNLNITFSSSSACPNENITFNSSGADINTIVSWFWDFGDGKGSSVIQNPSYSFDAPGTYYVKRSAFNTCGNVDIDSVLITIDSTIAASPNFSWSPNPACPNTPIDFTNTTTNWIDVLWDFGDGTSSSFTGIPFSHAFVSSGSYNVTLKVTNSCGNIDSITKSVNISNGILPSANFLANPNIACMGSDIDFTNISTGDNTSYFWDFGNGDTSTQENPSYVYSSTGDYGVILTVSNQCGNQSSKIAQIKVLNNIIPNANFTISSNACEGDVISLNNSSTGASQFSWDFGDGNTSSLTSPNHSYSIDGDKVVQLIATSSCGTDTFSKTITIFDGAIANFTDNSTGDCFGLDVIFTDSSTGNPTSWLWDFGDGNISTSANPGSHSYSKANVYNVTLIINKSGCTSIKTKTLGVCGVGINELNTNKFLTVYPNPSSDIINLKTNIINNNIIIEVFNIVGQRVLTKKTDMTISNDLKLDISNINNGVYFIKINNQDNQNLLLQGRFIKTNN